MLSRREMIAGGASAAMDEALRTNDNDEMKATKAGDKAMAYKWETHYRQPAADMSAVGTRFADGVVEKFWATSHLDRGIAITPGGGVFMSGYPANPETVPTEAQFLENPKKIPSVMGSSGARLVDSKVKEAIEALEPGVHQFFPIRLLWKNGELAEERWALNICQRIDSVDKEKSDIKIKKTKEGVISYMLPYGNKRKVVMIGQNIQSKHLWLDKYYTGNTAFLSDELMAAFKAAGVTGGQFDKVEAV